VGLGGWGLDKCLCRRRTWEDREAKGGLGWRWLVWLRPACAVSTALCRAPCAPVIRSTSRAPRPSARPPARSCALALAGLSRTKPPGSREALSLLAEAVNYLRAVLAAASPDAEALRPAAAEALAAYEAQLGAGRARR
jgi:hypothetical protein